jgi:D-amino-acid oxidase
VVDVTEYYDDRDDDSTIWYKRMAPKYRRLSSKDLPANAKIGFKYQSMTVNPAVFLPWIKAVLDKKRVRFIRAEVKSLAEARSILQTKVIVNASGLGAFDLANDDKVVAVRGQTMLVESDSHEMVMFQGSHYTYQIPRMYSGGVIVGGVSQPGNMDQEVDPEVRSDILRRMNLILNDQYQDVDLDKHVMKDLVGFRPSREGGYRLEREDDVIHAYGFNTLGYTYSYGVALKVRDLVRSSTDEKGVVRSKL